MCLYVHYHAMEECDLLGGLVKMCDIDRDAEVTRYAYALFPMLVFYYPKDLAHDHQATSVVDAFLPKTLFHQIPMAFDLSDSMVLTRV